jgi:hypothetical protein
MIAPPGFTSSVSRHRYGQVVVCPPPVATAVQPPVAVAVLLSPTAAPSAP